MTNGDQQSYNINVEEVMGAVRGISFDALIIYEHSRDDNDERLACARLAIDRSGNKIASGQRWQPVAIAANDWMRSDYPWLDAIDRVDASQLTIGNLQTIELLKSRKIRSVIAVPLIQDGRITTSLMLGSERRAYFRQAHFDQLRAPAMLALLQRVQDRLHDRRVRFLSEVRKAFKVGLSPDALAADLVRMIAEENDWDFVGIYRVEDEFVMVASCDRTAEQSLQMDQHYRQPLHVGMLGATLRAGKCLRADDVTMDPPPFGYSAIEGFMAKSALSYPIRVGGTVVWILDCASVAYAAFRGPDRQLLDELVDGLQSTLALWFETRLSHAILDGLTEPVLVVDRDGIVRRANSAACHLFGWTSEAECRERSLHDFAANDDTAVKLRFLGMMQGEEVTLRAATGEPRTMLATSKLSSEPFGHYVLKLSTKGEQQWLAGLEFARTTLETEVSQSRAILMLAAALLDRVRETMQGDPSLRAVDTTLERIGALLNQADLSYDKLAGALIGKTDNRLGLLVQELLARDHIAKGKQGGRDFTGLLKSIAGQAITSALSARLIPPSERQS